MTHTTSRANERDTCHGFCNRSEWEGIRRQCRWRHATALGVAVRRRCAGPAQFIWTVRLSARALRRPTPLGPLRSYRGDRRDTGPAARSRRSGWTARSFTCGLKYSVPGDEGTSRLRTSHLMQHQSKAELRQKPTKLQGGLSSESGCNEQQTQPASAHVGGTPLRRGLPLRARMHCTHQIEAC